jgi:hypothetical protein
MSKTIRKALAQRVDEAVDGLISMWIIAGSILIPAALVKASILYLVQGRP